MPTSIPAFPGWVGYDAALACPRGREDGLAREQRLLTVPAPLSGSSKRHSLGTRCATAWEEVTADGD